MSRQESYLQALLTSPNLPNLGLQSDAWGALSRTSSGLSNIAMQLSNTINSTLFDVYSGEPTREQMESNWIALLQVLNSAFDRIDIVTTNYDLVAEHAVEFSGVRVSRGAAGAIRQTLDEDEWRRDISDGARSGTGLISKLHGSLDWARRDGQIVIGGDGAFHGDHSRHAMIYPGFKGAPESEPFKLLHEWFEVALARADVVVSIGFAFRDEYLNQCFERAGGRRHLLVVVNPDTTIKPHYHDSWHFLPVWERFDADSVELVKANIESFLDSPLRRNA